MRFVCLLAKQHAAFKLTDTNSGFSVSQSSAEALVRWGEKIKYLLIAYFVNNVSAENYQNRFMYVKVIANQMWDAFCFLGHGVFMKSTMHWRRSYFICQIAF